MKFNVFKIDEHCLGNEEERLSKGIYIKDRSFLEQIKESIRLIQKQTLTKKSASIVMTGSRNPENFEMKDEIIKYRMDRVA